MKEGFNNSQNFSGRGTGKVILKPSRKREGGNARARLRTECSHSFADGHVLSDKRHGVCLTQNDAKFCETHIEKLFCGAFFSKKATSLVESPCVTNPPTNQNSKIKATQSDP